MHSNVKESDSPIKFSSKSIFDMWNWCLHCWAQKLVACFLYILTQSVNISMLLSLAMLRKEARKEWEKRKLWIAHDSTGFYTFRWNSLDFFKVSLSAMCFRRRQVSCLLWACIYTSTAIYRNCLFISFVCWVDFVVVEATKPTFSIASIWRIDEDSHWNNQQEKVPTTRMTN